EHHDEAVPRDEHVEHVTVGEILQARLLQLHAHHDGQEATHQPAHDGEQEIHGADVFVIGGVEPAPNAVGRMGVLAPGCVICVRLACHLACLRVCTRAANRSASANRVRSARDLAPHHSGLASPAILVWSGRLTAMERIISLAFFLSRAFSAAAQSLNVCWFTTRTAIGMNAWSLPHSSEHWPK